MSCPWVSAEELLCKVRYVAMARVAKMTDLRASVWQTIQVEIVLSTAKEIEARK
ncbi:MAG TPA: hypothetical protein VE616_03550 [Candidatus Udaeobacter sp.]|nr:hypothetical protein [Candidatus Udaeobacter sp.]